MKTNKLLLLALVLVLMLAACGSGGDKSIKLEDPSFGTFTVKYPGDWVAGIEDGQIAFANSQGAFEADVAEPGMAMSFPIDEVATLGAEEGGGPESLIGVFLEFFASEGGEFGEIETLQINDRDAASVRGTTTIEGATLNLVLVVVDEGDGFGIIVITSSDDIGEYETIARDMAGKLELDPN